MFFKNINFCGVILCMYFLCLFNLNAQGLPTAEQIKTNPTQYDVEEINKIQNWINDNPNVKIIAKTEYNMLSNDDKFYLEGYGHLIIYNNDMLTMTEIDAYKTKKNSIISRSYADYKTYLAQNDPQKFFEWFGY